MALQCLADITRSRAADRPDELAVICDDRSLTYAELDAEANRVADALVGASVGSQDRVGFIGKNIAEYFTLLFGAAKVNAVTVAVNWRLAAPEMAYILDDAQAKVVVVEEEFVGHIDQITLAADPLIVVVGAGGDRLEPVGRASTILLPVARRLVGGQRSSWKTTSGPKVGPGPDDAAPGGHVAVWTPWVMVGRGRDRGDDGGKSHGNPSGLLLDRRVRRTLRSPDGAG